MNYRLLFICGAMVPFAAWARQHRPNIIYIMTDQQSANAMSCAGNADLHTPNMDRLAAMGVRFENAYCTLPLSGPSRSSMFTGFMPSDTGMTENGTPLPDSLAQQTLGTLLSDAGYTCAYAGNGMYIPTPYLRGRLSVSNVCMGITISGWPRRVLTFYATDRMLRSFW